MRTKQILYTLVLILLLNFCSAISYGQSSAGISQVTTDSALAIYRKKIDSLDKQLIRVVGEREKIVREVGIFKAKYEVAPLQAARFQQVIDKCIEEGKKEGLSAAFVTQLMNLIHNESLQIENSLRR